MSTSQTKTDSIQVDPRDAMRFATHLKSKGNRTFAKTIEMIVGDQVGAGAKVVTLDKKAHVDAYQYFLLYNPVEQAE